MNIKLITTLAAGVLMATTAVPVLAIPAVLPIDYRVGGVPAGSSATGIGGGSVTQNGEGLGVNSSSVNAFNDDNSEVGPGETLTVTLGANVTGAWVLNLFDEAFDDAGTVELFNAVNVSLGTFGFNGLGNAPAGTGELFVDFGGSILVDHAKFSAGSSSTLDQVFNKDYSVAGFTQAAVPDGGTNLVFLGTAVSVLGLMRRKLIS
jgi:hypothetical protein